MICFPNGKINLGLRVLSKRADGFHNIESLLYPVPICDALEFLPSGTFQLRISGFSVSGSTSDNLIFRAWQLLHKLYLIPPVKVHLHKAIPLQSGLGGGSADAAFFIREANTLFKLQIDEDKMEKLASILGSDCSFFIKNKPALATGKGEVLQSANISLKGKYLLIVKAGADVSSRKAYTLVQPAIPETDLAEILTEPLEQWRNLLQNDFEKPVFKRYPDIGKTKNNLYKMGAVYSSMSGSGSAVFGIFNQQPELNKISPNVYLWHGKI